MEARKEQRAISSQESYLPIDKCSFCGKCYKKSLKNTKGSCSLEKFAGPVATTYKKLTLSQLFFKKHVLQDSSE